MPVTGRRPMQHWVLLNVGARHCSWAVAVQLGLQLCNWSGAATSFVTNAQCAFTSLHTCDNARPAVYARKTHDNAALASANISIITNFVAVFLLATLTLQKMDTFAYTVSQPELPPISELGNWAELSIAKNRDWDKTNFKPWYADFLPYNPKDPYGMKRLGEEKKTETVENPAQQPAVGKDSSKTARSKPHSNLVTSNMRRLLEFFGY